MKLERSTVISWRAAWGLLYKEVLPRRICSKSKNPLNFSEIHLCWYFSRHQHSVLLALWICICICICNCICICGLLNTRISIHVDLSHGIGTLASPCTRICTCTCICSSISSCICSCVRICISTFICICFCVCICCLLTTRNSIYADLFHGISTLVSLRTYA